LRRATSLAVAFLCFIAALPYSGFAQTASSAVLVPAILTQPIDTKKAKNGDEVTGKVMNNVSQDGTVVIPKNTKVSGHITMLQAKGDKEAKLAFVFDKFEINGKPVQARAYVIALAPPSDTYDMTLDQGQNGSMSNSSQAVSSRARTTPTANAGGRNFGGAATLTGARNSLDPASDYALDLTARGVLGLSDISMTPATSMEVGPVLVSKKNIKVEKNSQLVLMAAASSFK
jgi:hypothetical protein